MLKLMDSGGLTLTWDVLKSQQQHAKLWRTDGLTLTWDVLKLKITTAMIINCPD